LDQDCELLIWDDVGATQTALPARTAKQVDAVKQFVTFSGSRNLKEVRENSYRKDPLKVATQPMESLRGVGTPRAWTRRQTLPWEARLKLPSWPTLPMQAIRQTIISSISVFSDRSEIGESESPIEVWQFNVFTATLNVKRWSLARTRTSRR
jgi:hypothetical protein